MAIGPWDPVENAGLLPWFTATAFLHSNMIQEQRGMLKVWNLVLVIVTFFLTIFGTFMTRSGVVQSVHSFGEDNELALLFILFMAFVLIMSFGLLIFRSPKLRSSNTFDSFVSREFAFLLNNWILLACAAFVLFATMFPTLSEAVNGERISVGPDFFNKWMTPLGLVLLFLAGVAPLLAWRRTTTERLYSQFLFPTRADRGGAVGVDPVCASHPHPHRDFYRHDLAADSAHRLRVGGVLSWDRWGRSSGRARACACARPPVVPRCRCWAWCWASAANTAATSFTSALR